MRELRTLDAAVLGAFDQALTDYLAQIDRLGPELRRTFQSTLNEGFRDLYLLYGAACLLLLGLLPLIPVPPEPERADQRRRRFPRPDQPASRYQMPSCRDRQRGQAGKHQPGVAQQALHHPGQSGPPRPPVAGEAEPSEEQQSERAEQPFPSSAMVAKMHSRSGSKGFLRRTPGGGAGIRRGDRLWTGRPRTAARPIDCADDPRGDGPAAMRRASASPVMSGRRWVAAVAARAGWWQC